MFKTVAHIELSNLCPATNLIAKDINAAAMEAAGLLWTFTNYRISSIKLHPAL